MSGTVDATCFRPYLINTGQLDWVANDVHRIEMGGSMYRP